MKGGEARAVWTCRSYTQYTPAAPLKGELFKGFQRGLFREGSTAPTAGDEVDRLPHRHRDPKIKTHPPMVTGGTGNFLEAIRNIRLRAEVELHIGIDGKAVVASFADATPFPVGLHESLINAERAFFANGALDATETLFNLFDGWTAHWQLDRGRWSWMSQSSIRGETLNPQPARGSRQVVCLFSDKLPPKYFLTNCGARLY